MFGILRHRIAFIVFGMMDVSKEPQLEFQEIPDGQWLSINVPAQLSLQTTDVKRIVEYKQSYTLKGLNKGTKYRVRLRDKL